MSGSSIASSGPIGRLRRGAEWVEDRYLSVDIRWLGVFRILYGVLLCVDLLRRWAHAADFYTNDGILPNHFSLFRPLGHNVFSLYHAFSTLPQVNVAFALTLAIFVTFTLGYRTLLFHVLSLVCITSLNARNLMVENGGTVVVNLLAFWTLFLPLGRCLSIDSLLASLRGRSDAADDDLNLRSHLEPGAYRHYSLVVLALLLQWSFIYFFNVVHKSGEGWRNGSAIHWFLYQDRIITTFGIWVREHAPYSLLRLFTYSTLGVEAALSVLLLLPVQQVWCRRLALVFALGLHGGIAATSRLGPFSYAMTLFFVLPLGAADWDAVRRALSGRRRALTVVYDAECGFCFEICRVLARLDLHQRLTFVGNNRRDRLPAELSPQLLQETVVAIDGAGRHLLRARAISAIISSLPLWGLGIGYVLRVPGLSQLADWGYRVVSERRHHISGALGLGVCGVSEPSAERVGSGAPRTSSPRLWPALAGRPMLALREVLVLLAVVLMVNQLAIDNAWARQRVHATQPAPLKAVVDTFRLLQGWRMFAPEPPYEDGRVVVDARTSDGRNVDPLTGEAPDFDPHTDVGWGHSQLWCDYHLKMSFSGYSAYRQFLKQYLQDWHRRTGRPEDRLVAFDVWWVHDRSPAPGQTRGEALEPARLLSFGRVKDSGAAPWIERAKARAKAASDDVSSGGG